MLKRYKSHKDNAGMLEREVTSYLSRMQRYAIDAQKLNVTLKSTYEQLSTILDSYHKGKLSGGEFIEMVMPYRKELKGMKRTRKDEKRLSEERKTLDIIMRELEKLAAVILLAVITFSLFSSIFHNPSITGFAVLGTFQSNSTILPIVLNLIAFIAILLLVYPKKRAVFVKSTKRKNKK